MSMTQAQAKKLGNLISRTRLEQGLSTRDLAVKVGVHHSWIGYLEQGRYVSPAADRLAVVAQTLGIAPDQIARINLHVLSAGLPAPRSYFRAKYGLSAQEAQQVERYIEDLRGES